MRGHDLRRDIIETARAMNALGINQGTSGNLSARIDGGFLVTPSGIDYEACAPDDIIRMTMDGTPDGPHKPSSEWRMHRDLLAARPEVQAVLHAHPTFSTVLACMRRAIPPFHSMVAVAGNLKGVLTRASEVETLARQYCLTLQIGEPVLLTDAEMDEALEKIKIYTHSLDVIDGG